MQQRDIDDALTLARTAGKGLEGTERLAWIERLTESYGRIQATLRWLLDSAETESGVELLGNLYWFLAEDTSRRHEAREWYRRFLTHRTDLPQASVTRVLDLAGGLALNDGDYLEARHWCEQALAVRREIGDRVGVGYSLCHLGHIAQETGDTERAWRLRSDALELFRSLTDRPGIMAAAALLGELALDRHDAVTAAPFVRESVQLSWELKQEVLYGFHHDLAASYALEIGHVQMALRLAGAADGLRRRFGLIPEVVQEGTPEHPFCEARATLGYYSRRYPGE